MSDPYPIADLTAAVPELKRPFTVAAVRMKPQTVTKDKTKGLVTYYIDARMVVERLNAVVGAGAWSDSYRPLNVGQEALAVGIPVECALQVLGVTKTDVGQIAPGEKDDKMWKSAYSDAFKRAAVKFGIGAYLYGGAQVWAAVKVGANDKVQGFSPEGVAHAKREYVKWITALAPLWGQPLDHGDVEHDAEMPPDGHQTASAAPEAQAEAVDPAVTLIAGAPAGAKFLQDGMKMLTDCDPRVDWPSLVGQVIRDHFGVEKSGDIPKERYREFAHRYANACAATRAEFTPDAVPPIDDAGIMRAWGWAFGGLAVTVPRISTDGLPEFGA